MTTSTLVPGAYDVAIDGVPFLLWENSDTSSFTRTPMLEHESLETQREQAQGAATNIGELTINPNGFWRRSRDGWHDGAGQSYADRDESDPLRFRTSRGVDVFGTRHQVSLLKTMDEAYALTSASNVWLYEVADYVYFLDNSNTAAKFVSAITAPWSPTTITGAPVDTITSVCAIGSTVFFGTAASGVYSATVGGGSMSSYVTSGSATAVWAAKGRLMVAGSGGTLYNVTGSGALPTALATFPTGLTVVGVTGALNWIYVAVAGASSASLIYKTTIKPDGTALDVPTVAGEFPDGEVVTNGLGNPIFGYLGFLFVHTNKGIRMAEIDSDGNLTFGSIITSASTNEAAWTAEGRFVWFNFDIPNSGGAYDPATGRLDLSVTTLPLTPAYAADLETGDTLYPVTSLTTASGRRIAATLHHIYVESDDYVTSGHIDSGLIALDLADPKTPVSIDVEAGGLDATHTVTEALSTDRGATFTTVGTWNDEADGDTTITGIAAARQFELRTTLTGDGSSSPTLYRHTLKVEPNVSQGSYITARLNLFERVVTNVGQAEDQDVTAKRVALEALQASKAVVVFQEGAVNYNVTLRDLQWDTLQREQAPSDGAWSGVATVRMKVIPS